MEGELDILGNRHSTEGQQPWPWQKLEEGKLQHAGFGWEHSGDRYRLSTGGWDCVLGRPGRSHSLPNLLTSGKVSLSGIGAGEHLLEREGGVVRRGPPASCVSVHTEEELGCPSKVLFNMHSG